MIPRLYIDAPLAPGGAAPLSADQAHYLRTVLRREIGAPLRLFNGREGEFAGEIADLGKKGGIAAIAGRTRAQDAEPDLTLFFAPVKRAAVEMIAQKATEIGVRRLVPVITQRVTAPKPNLARLRAIALEAAEQCGRLTVPSVDEPVKLADLLEAPGVDRLLFCDEAGDDEAEDWGGREGRAAPVLEALKTFDRDAEAWGVVTGPEGGFTPAERASLRARDFVTPATLGPRVLRADTAALAALVLWQAAAGDWRRR